MPAKSVAQQRFMGIVHALQKGEKVSAASPEAKKVAKSMTKKDAKDFASTKHDNLPDKVKEMAYDKDPQSSAHISKATGKLEPDDFLYISKKLKKMASKNAPQKIPIKSLSRTLASPPQSESLMLKYFPTLFELTGKRKPGQLLKHVTDDNKEILQKMIKKVMSRYNVSPKVAVIALQKAADNLV